MKRLTILIGIILIIISCEYKKNHKKEIHKPEIEIQKATTNSLKHKNDSINDSYKEYFDWSKSISLKKDLIAKLKNNKLQSDKIVIDYLESLDELIDKYNEKLFNRSDYETLNALAYLNDENIDKRVLDFKEQVEKNGLHIASSEGMIYIEKNTTFIKSETFELLDSISVDFLNLYCHEIDNKCCEDAGIIISENELVSRIFNWGNLMEKVIGTNYSSISKEEFNKNLSLLLMGQPNTPSFDYVSKKYNKKSYDLMIEIIEQYPNSKAADEFKPIIELIKSEKFEQTEKVNEYYKERFNNSG